MNFQHVSLRNFKCFADADLDLDTGVTVIHGVNGSGKSTLLEACFFALYGSKALDDRNLEDIITNGEEETEVELRFRHDGADYRIERRVRYSGDRPKTATCVLEGPDHTIEGARAVRQEVADLLRMDADAFVNCAYVRQGEVNKLIHATPTERQDMIDDLLQLGRLEEYRERAAEARLAVEDVLENVRGQADQLDRQIAAKEEKGLHATLNDLESDRKEVVADIERYEDQRAEAERTRDQAAEILAAHEEKREELEAVREDIADLRDAIAETESEREQLGERLRERRQERTELAERRDDLLAESDLDAAEPAVVEAAIADHREADDRLQERIEALKVAIQEHSSEADRLRERATELADEAEQQRERATELDAEVEDDEAALADRREKLDDLDADIEAAEATFEDAPVDFGEAEGHLADLEDERADLVERRQTVRAERESASERVAEAEELKAEGKCPECGQDVSEAPHVDALSEYRERVETLDGELDDLDDELAALDERIERAEDLVEAEREAETLRENRNNVEALLADKRETLEDRRERLAECRERATELDAEAADKREAAETAAETADEKRTELGEVNGERQTVRERIERLETLADVLDDLADADEDVESLEAERESLAERNDERREWLAEKRDRRDELEDAYDAERVEEAREERERATNYIEQVDERLEGLRERRDDLTDRIGGVRNELDELESLRERRETVVARRERLDSLHDETERLQAMYGDLRAELRQRNVETLERMLNETFDLVYQNDSYSHIDLDSGYQLTVYQKDGEPLSPEQLSGGERALFNLSLRCAIYELLSEGIEGSAPMPPLILDEPTVFLDAGHVSQLVTLVESMRDVGVEQILVVSHDEELVGAADELVQVRKDATSNRSSVERGEQLLVP